ncbi:MAG: hypothetical protein IJ551_09975 [Prevotella sp.]|nr:hypothetical protein [Prevotella sp.]
MNQEKLQVTQDVLYQYLTEHNVNLSGMAREMGANPTMVAGCFKRMPDRHGKPRHFTAQTLPRLNSGLPLVAQRMREGLVTFGSDQTYTNNRGATYDPATMPQIKGLSRWFNLTAFLMRVLGWTESKKNFTFSAPSSGIYGCISRDDVNRINAELLSVAGVLSSYEVVADGETEPQTADVKTDSKPTRKRMEQTFESQAQPWDDTSLSLPERASLLRERWPQGVLLFRVNGGYTAEGDDARMLNEIDTDIAPYTDYATGLTTAYMDADQMAAVLPRLVADGRRVMMTDMYKE